MLRNIETRSFPADTYIRCRHIYVGAEVSVDTKVEVSEGQNHRRRRTDH